MAQVRRGLAEQKESGDRASDTGAETDTDTDADEFRAVAPPVMSFASGRRR